MLFKRPVYQSSPAVLGHTMGLPHCTVNRTRFMETAEGTIKSVDM
jgi:predicted Zn-dependent protease